MRATLLVFAVALMSAFGLGRASAGFFLGEPPATATGLPLMHVMQDGRPMTADSRSWRHAAALRFDGGGLCTAALVHSKALLTSAHCLQFRDERQEVLVQWFDGYDGFHHVYQPSEYELVFRGEVPSRRNMELDLVLLRFQEEIIPSYEYFDPMLVGSILPEEAPDIFAQDLYFVGVGPEDGQRGTPYDPILSFGKVRVERKQHGLLYARSVDGSTICPGDSGGPLFVYDEILEEFMLVGILQGGRPGCADWNWFNHIDMSVAAWVRSETADLFDEL